MSIPERVKSQYQRFPYPKYPLLATPHWQDGILGASGLVSGLSKAQGHPALITEKRVLILGCGDMQPYIFAKLEGSGSQVFGIDLSRHAIRRAKFRLMRSMARARLLACDLDDFLEQDPSLLFHHIDAYGVLHHLANPSQSLVRMAKKLAPGGTLRVMVYNRQARRWIYHVARIFKLLSLSYAKESELALARQFIEKAAVFHPLLQERLSAMGPSLLGHDSRFVDAFFHEREVNLDYKAWLAAFERADLRPLGLFDRYGELDHLENPLLALPKLDLSELALAGNFMGNFEFYLEKPGGAVSPAKASLSPRLSSLIPPRLWFSYPETKSIPWLLRFKLWHNFRREIYGERWPRPDNLYSALELPALKRLARVGAILPDFHGLSQLRAQLLAPLALPEETAASLLPSACDWQALTQLVSHFLASQNLKAPQKRQALIMAHLERI